MDKLQIYVSPIARDAIGFESALTGKKLVTVASEAILKGVSDKALKLAEEKQSIEHPMERLKTLTMRTCNPDSLRVPKGQLAKDAEAVSYILANMDKMSGAKIAEYLDRAPSSVCKFIAAKKKENGL
jgi:hypothetical protein